MKTEMIDVCGARFLVIDRTAQRTGDTNFGEINTIEGTISLNEKMPEGVREVTLIHEWLHGVFTSNALDHTEQQVGVLSTELYRQGFRVPRIMPPKHTNKPKSKRRS